MTLEYTSAAPGGQARPASGEVPLRRPRDGRRGRGRGRGAATGAIPLPPPTADGTEVATTAIPLRGVGPGSGPVPQARSTGTPPAGLTGPIRQLLGPMTGSLRLGIGRPDSGTDQRLRVDWPQCKAHGLCAEIAPEIIHLDEWGYPVFDQGSVPGSDLPTARKAVQVCPTLALRLVDAPPRS
jgi:ferredoxin